MKFTLTISQDKVKPAYQDALKKVAKNTTIKGFRKGKAPIDKVEQEVDKTKIYELIIDDLLPAAYADHLKEHDLRPIAEPRIVPQSISDDEDWVFEVEIAQMPEIKLNDYKKAIKAALAKDEIWTPEKGKEEEEKELTPDEKEQKKLTVVFDTLLNTAEVEIPQLLIDKEANRALSRLVSQIDQLGLSIEDYAKSTGKDIEGIKKEYQKTAEENLKLDFILQEVAKDLELEVEDKEVEEVLKEVQDEETRKKLEADQLQMASIKYSLLKRKTVQYLTDL